MTQTEELDSLAASFLRPASKQTPAEWCCENLVIPPPQTETPGPFSLAGREYGIEPLNRFADPEAADTVLCFGSQTGKSTILKGGVAWSVVEDPSGILWVMPSISLAQSFSETRWTPIVNASPVLADLMPQGSRRHDFKKLQQQLGAALINFIGSNSPANLASRPARRVIQDEVDKFDMGGRGEADASDLADQRTKSFSNPQRWKTSTPTIYSGLIWQQFLRGNQKRFKMPCPHCGKKILLAWSKQYTVFRLTGDEAFVVWDKEARKKGGGWDLDRVLKSARAICPHCAGHIHDGHKTKMIREGFWQAFNPYVNDSFASYHLPSFYAATAETTFGKMAVKFLKAKNSLLGLQGIINGDFAEPYEMQDRLSERAELVSARVEVSDEWKPLLTVDCQAKAPHFWHVVRVWSGKKSQAISAGPLDTWDEVRTIQTGNKVPDVCTMVDSGFGAKSDSEVYAECAKFCELVPRRDGLPLALGWMPAKGMPSAKRWRDPETNAMLPWFLRSIDPFLGTKEAGQVVMTLFEFSGEFFKDILENMREGKDGFEWSVADGADSEDYWRHLNAKIKTAVFNKRTGKTTYQWQKRSEHWPDHLDDCEIEQVALASFHRFFDLENV